MMMESTRQVLSIPGALAKAHFEVAAHSFSPRDEEETSSEGS